MQNNLNQKYVCQDQAQVLAMMEIEFEEDCEMIKNLFESNEEMLKFDPNDYDLITARKENLELINKTILKLQKIQNEIKTICPIHPICEVDVFDFFDKNSSAKKNDNKLQTNEEIIKEIEI